jgi:hypothetical protein
MSPIPALLLLMAQTPAPLSGTAVDREGRPLAGVEVALVWGQEKDGSVPILARATTDARGRYDLALPPSTRPSSGYVSPFLAASASDFGLVLAVTSFKKDQAGGYRLVFNPAKRRRFTLRGGDGRALGGVRLSPLTLVSRQEQYLAVTLPDTLADRLAVTTGPEGRAEMDGLEPVTALYAVRARVPGLGSCTLGLTPSQFKSNAVEIDLKPVGSLAGRVVRADGLAVADAEIEVWSWTSPLEVANRS